MKSAALAILLVVSVSAAPSSKIEQRLGATLSTKGHANVLVTFNERTAPALSPFKTAKFASRDDRLNAVYKTLNSLAKTSQQDAVSVLSKQSRPIDYEVFWITNQIYIRDADSSLIDQLASLDSVSNISEEFEVRLDDPIDTTVETTPRKQGALANEWGVDNIEAPAAWDLSNGGEGIRICGIDTGVHATHTELSSNFVGTNYGWRDVTLFGTQTPRDDNGHGTHTVGSIVGVNGIGVAPKAKWMACKALNGAGSGTNAGLISCGQWAACPTLPNNNSPDCTKAPHVVSNSWGGGQANPFYNDVINAWHAANIIPVFANGNSGPDCQTANSPADSLAGVIAVGATDVNNGMAVFSSKGPTAGGRMKPDISAPGLAIRSAWNNGTEAYATISGTSMATPHVAGVVALVLGANPNLDYQMVYDILTKNTNQEIVETNMNCGGVNENVFPNHAFGHGIVNARKSVIAALAAP